MSWSRGSELFSNIIDIIKTNGVDFETRKSIYEQMIESFMNLDCNTLNECIGEDRAFDAVWKMLNEEDSEDDYDDED